MYQFLKHVVGVLLKLNVEILLMLGPLCQIYMLWL